jgi:hypothetical protein
MLKYDFQYHYQLEVKYCQVNKGRNGKSTDNYQTTHQNIEK